VASVEKRTRNGKVSYSVRYRDPAGRSRRKVFARKVDAQRFLIEIEGAKQPGRRWVDPAARKVKLGEWAERWYQTKVLAPTTMRDYRKSLDLEILPAFAAAPLHAIDALAVEEWLAGLARRGLGVKRRAKARAVLSMVLDSAVKGGKLARNVVADVAAPKGQRREAHFLDAAQVERLAAAIDPRYRALVLFAPYTGVRPSELVALTVGRLDLLRGTARIAAAAPEVDGKLEFGDTKTDKARTVHVPRSVAGEVAAMLAGRANLGPDSLVFVAPLGGPLRFSKWIDVTFKPALAAAGLPAEVRLYDLRHTCASLLIAEGATVKAIQAQLGHATATMTLDLYGHLFPDELPMLAERLDATRAAAAADVWPRDGPAVVALRERAGQVP
jgi:integrase